MIMKKICLLWISCLFSTALLAQWKPVGNGDYDWGPFHVYNVSLYSENGEYQDGQRPMMLSFKFAKPVEGRSFIISLIKEIKGLDLGENVEKNLESLQRAFPDFVPNDILSYIALEDKGYFILNDEVLEFTLDAQFNQALLDIWLSPKTSFSKLQKKLLGKEQSSELDIKELMVKPEVQQLHEGDIEPQLPPNFELNNISRD
ncbi:chalcone isomerase family protein [Canicola haemoglobinophilus]|nr:chalcone isomerase family protein [Canicola haemoglobinophilus]